MPIAWIGGVFLFLTANPTPQSFAIGIPVAMAGMLVRAWASGYMVLKEKVLASDGPFAHVRNPLYLGSLLVGLGVVIIVNSWVALAVFVLGFTALYIGTVRKEEGVLLAKLGEPYRLYAQSVPRFLPRLSPYPGRIKTGFDGKLILRHRELETLFAVWLIITGLYLWKGIVLEGVFAKPQYLAIAAGVVCIVGLIMEKRLRKRFS